MSAWCWLAAVLLTAAPSWQRLPDLPDPLGVAGAFAGVTGDALLVAGGANFPHGFPWEGGTKVWHDRVWLLDAPTGAWRTLPPLPGPRAYGVSLTTNRGVVCVGGSDSQRHFADACVLRWDGTSLHRTALPDLPQPVANACGALVGGRVYIAGGETRPGAVSALPTLWSLDLAATDTGWQTLPPCPGGPRALATAGALGEAFYLCGGVDLTAGPDAKPQRRYLRDAWAYAPARGWRRLADLPHALAAGPSPAAVAAGDRLLLVGGDDGSKLGFQPVAQHPGFCAELLVYDRAADAWSVEGTTPAPRATAPCVRWRGQTVVVSGEVRPGVRSPQLWALGVADAPESR